MLSPPLPVLGPYGIALPFSCKVMGFGLLFFCLERFRPPLFFFVGDNGRSCPSFPPAPIGLGPLSRRVPPAFILFFFPGFFGWSAARFTLSTARGGVFLSA